MGYLYLSVSKDVKGAQKISIGIALQCGPWALKIAGNKNSKRKGCYLL